MVVIAEQVRQAQDAQMRAWQTGDSATYLQYLSRDVIGFGASGDLADHATDQAHLDTLYRLGYRASISHRDRTVRVYGNAALSTGYLVGRFEKPDGTVQEGTFRYSEVRVREDGDWKLLQYHLSPLHV